MNRKLTNALASTALAAFVLAGAGLAAGAQTEQEPARTGKKVTKAVAESCPVHPEFKAKSAGKCPKCRMEMSKQKGAKEKDKNKVRSQEAAPANE